MKKIIYIFIAILTFMMFSSCNYNELPPKKKNASTDYLLPKGELPTEAEKAEVAKIKEEYNNAIK